MSKFIIPEDIFIRGDKQHRLYGFLSQDNYHHYYDTIIKYGVKSVLEIGVRLGYSAFSMLSANPKMFFHGIDICAHTSLDYARVLLTARFPDAEIMLEEKDSHSIKSFEREYDLAHIDGDHSYSGALQDLFLVSKNAKMLFVHDYDLIPDTRKAVDEFLATTGYVHEYVPSFRGHMIVHTGGKGCE